MFESRLVDWTGVDLPLPDAPFADQLAALAAIDPAALDSDHLALELVAAWERVSTWASARAVAALTEFARRPADTRLGEPGATRRPPGHLARSHADDELAVRLGSSRRAVAWRLEAALRLPEMPVTARLFGAGLLDSAKTRVMVEECATASAATIDTVETTVLDERVLAQPVSRLRDRVRGAVIAADPEQAVARADRARARRSISVTPLPDAMAELVATLPAEDAAAIRAAVDAAARRLRAGAGENRSLDQLRADCLAAPFWQALRTGRLDGAEPVPLAGAQGEPAAIQVTVPAAVLLGLSDRPGTLAGYGPIPAPLARRLAADGRWRRVLTDPVGGPVATGAETYRPSRATARAVIVRDQRCRFPGCSAPALRCDLDHVVPFPDGRSEPTNLIALCRRHHLLKHGGQGGQAGPAGAADRPAGLTDRATPTGDAGAELEWRMPDGSRRSSSPPPLGDPLADAELLRALVRPPDPPDPADRPTEQLDPPPAAGGSTRTDPDPSPGQGGCTHADPEPPPF